MIHYMSEVIIMTTAERIDGILNARGMSRRQLAMAAHIPPSSLQSAMARGRNMTIEMLLSIADTLKVSTDYLLCVSNDPAPKASAVDDLGLSPRAVQYLQTLHGLSKANPSDTRLSLLSDLLEDNSFDTMLSTCTKYVSLMKKNPAGSFVGSADYIFCVDTLKAHDFAIATPREKASLLFDNTIAKLLRRLLDEEAASAGD